MSEVKLLSSEVLMQKEPDPARLHDVYEVSKTDRRAAIQAYEKLSRDGSLLAKLYLGYVHRGLGETDEALRGFTQALEGGSDRGGSSYW